jgi:hypothetical protein
MNKTDFLETVVAPTLAAMDADNLAARRLVMATALVESGDLEFTRQRLGRGRYGAGLGFFQMEMATAIWLAHDYLVRRPDVGDRLEAAFNLLSAVDLDWSDVDTAALEAKMLTDLRFQCAMCRLRYMVVPKPLPHADDLDGLAKYWLRHYNAGGKGTLDKFRTHAAWVMEQVK